MHTPKLATDQPIAYPPGGLTQKRFIQELRKLAGRSRVLDFQFLPPSEGFLVGWWTDGVGFHGMHGAADRREHFVKYAEMNEDTLNMFRVLWAVGA